MDIRLPFHDHPSDSVWEEYAFNRLAGAQLATAEEHLLLCQRCQRVLAEADQYIRLMKSGTENYSSNAAVRRGARKILSFPHTKKTIGALAAACLAVLLWVERADAPITPVPVPLRSYRGAAFGNRAPPKHPLDLQVSAEDVPRGSAYRFEVVTSAGGGIWNGEAVAKDAIISARMPKRLPAGLYWVRLYAQPSPMPAEYGLVAEYGLKVE